ncbi:MAG: hypothetical protein AMJ75_02910 [Phycisphaerae bacterium SM1_79]|nr:MAG: hypothetical protein AMJ75_02910 [Phycisphaerae bacterium SM1_79]
MIRMHKMAIYALAATLALIAITGCRKREPAPEPEVRQVQPTTPETEKAVGAQPTLRQGIKLKAAGEPIDVEIGHLVPCVCDWNSDGKKDLIVGQFNSGAIRLYLNQGTDTEPVFNDFSLLQAGGKQIRLDAG